MSMEYVLENKEMRVELSSLGGSLSSIRADGREYLWQGDPSVWSGQAPICFPICGGLREGRATTLSGEKVELARHGFAREQQFDLVSRNDCSIRLGLSSTPGLLARYPFSFSLIASYALVGRTLEVTYSIKNAGKRDMPFFIGGHPAFRCPLDEGEAYDNYVIEFERAENATVPRADVETGLVDVAQREAGPQRGQLLPLWHGLFSRSETIYDTLNSRSVVFRDAAGTKGLRLSFPELPYLIVWGKPGGDFVAIEPWSGLSTCSDEDDVIEHKRGCLVAAPDQVIRRGFTIHIL